MVISIRVIKQYFKPFQFPTKTDPIKSVNDSSAANGTIHNTLFFKFLTILDGSKACKYLSNPKTLIKIYFFLFWWGTNHV